MRNALDYHASWRWRRWFAWHPMKLGEHREGSWVWLCWVERSQWEFGTRTFYCTRLPLSRAVHSLYRQRLRELGYRSVFHLFIAAAFSCGQLR